MISRVVKSTCANEPVVLIFSGDGLISEVKLQELHHISSSAPKSTIMLVPDVLPAGKHPPDNWSHHYLKHLPIRLSGHPVLVLHSSENVNWQNWLEKSPDCSPLDISFWPCAVLFVTKKRFTVMEDLKKTVVNLWHHRPRGS